MNNHQLFFCTWVVLLATNTICQAVIVFADRTNAAIRTWNSDTSSLVTLVDIQGVFGPGNYGPLGIATDTTSVYWTDDGQRAIYSARLDGSGAARIIDTVALGSAIPAEIHVSDSSLYWVDRNFAGAIFTADLDGGNARELIDLNSVFGVGAYGTAGITSNGSTLFWTDNSQKAIYSSALDGTGAQKLFDLTTVLGPAAAEGISPLGITVGIATGYGPHESLFWTDTLSDAVFQIRLDQGDLGDGLGQALKIIDQDSSGAGGPFSPTGIAIVDSSLYFSDPAANGGAGSLVGPGGSITLSAHHIAAIPEPPACVLLGAVTICLLSHLVFRPFYLLRRFLE